MNTMKHTPWSDVIELYNIPDSQDAEGYGTGQITKRTIFCNFSDGVGQKEFYYAQKADLAASATVELWKVDYAGEEYADFGDKQYRVVRSFPVSFDTVVLILGEVTR